MPLAEYDFHLDSGADWQRVVRLRSTTGQLVSVADAVMEIRNANSLLALRLDDTNSRCTVLSDGASIQLHISADDSLTYFAWGNYPGSVQAVGYWGRGRSYLYDIFVQYTTGVTDRIMKGFFLVDPNITETLPAGPPAPVITSMVKDFGTNGDLVRLSGKALSGTTSVNFGGVQASFTVVNDGTVDFTVPNGWGPGATITVMLTTPYGSANPPALFTFV